MCVWSSHVADWASSTGMVANPARRGQLKKEYQNFPVRLGYNAWGFGLARQLRPSRPASARSSSTHRLDRTGQNLVLTHGLLCFLPLSTTSCPSICYSTFIVSTVSSVVSGPSLYCIITCLCISYWSVFPRRKLCSCPCDQDLSRPTPIRDRNKHFITPLITTLVYIINI